MSELFTLDTLQEFWAKRPKGAKIQYKSSKEIEWIHAQSSVPLLNNIQDYWRWEPQSKPIDLSPLVGSDVLCDASNGDGFTGLGFFDRIISDGVFMFRDGSEWQQCKPIMDMWMVIDAGQSIPEGLEFIVCEVAALGSNNFNVIMFTGLKEGYHWPWEDKS